MQITDFHIHSKYARACSKQLELEQIELWCQIKGIDIVACGDFTHPAWFKEIERKLEPLGNGFFRLHSPEQSALVRKESEIQVKQPREVFFTLGTEISCIYSQGGQVRRIHLLVIFPEMEHVKRFNQELTKRGAKLAADGRPILGMSTKLVAEIALSICEEVLLIPAHVWTPWFAIFGSKSGFDSVEECFEELSDYIYALETGLSSDPKMNWTLSQNDKYTLVSNSDAHSLDNLGREANVLDLPEVSYNQLFQTIKEGDPKRFKHTIEFYPEEGKYHLDGHRDCDFACMPEETKRLKERCPKCGRLLTVGVHHRISDLADKPLGREKDPKIPFKSIIPLQEIISDIIGVGKKSKKVFGIYKDLINQVGNEFYTLLDAPIEQIAQASTPMIAEGVKRMRDGAVELDPGFDGRYGVIRLFSDEERNQGQQRSLL